MNSSLSRRYGSRTWTSGNLFVDWGIPTPFFIQQIKQMSGATVIGSEGGVDEAKGIAFGNGCVGGIPPFLEGGLGTAVVHEIEQTVRKLRIVMFCVGARPIPEPQRV